MRTDTTTAEYQAAYRGRHDAGNGRDGQAHRYVRCACGWRLSSVPDRPAKLAKAYAAHRAHVAEVTTSVT